MQLIKEITIKTTLLALFVILYLLTFKAFSQTFDVHTISADYAYEVSAIETYDDTFIATWLADKENVDPNDNYHYNQRIMVSKSNDEGTTWTAPVPVKVSTNRQANPELIQLPNGEILLYFMNIFETGRSTIEVFKSTNDGDSWDFLSETVYKPNILQDLPRMEVFNDTLRLFVLEAEFGKENKLFARSSTDNGLTWDEGMLMKKQNDPVAHNSATCSDGSVLVGWGSYDNLPVWNTSTTLGFNHFSDLQPVISTPFRDYDNTNPFTWKYSAVEYVTSPTTGKVGLLAYAAHNIGEIYYIPSNDYGQTWGTPQLLNEFGTMPTAAFDQDDNLHISYIEFAPANGVHDYSTFYSGIYMEDGTLSFIYQNSTDNGLTFSDPQAIIDSIEMDHANRYIGIFNASFVDHDNKFNTIWVDWSSNSYQLKHASPSPISNIFSSPTQKQPVVEIFPNPTSGTVYLEMDHPVKKNHISVVDNSGHIILEKDFDGSSSELELAGKAAGMYTVKIENEEGSEIHYVILN